MPSVVLIAIGIAAALTLCAWVYASAQIGSGIFIDAQCTIAPQDGILLTFDDGPDAEVTPRVLDALDKHGHKAVFFIVGAKAERHPELVREIAARGHQIGNHTYSHSPYANFLGAKHLRREIETADKAIAAACGIRPALFRPPLGISTHFMRRVLLATGHKAMGWSIRSLDTRRGPRQAVLDRIVRRLRPGNIVLLHDRLDGAEWLADKVLEAWERDFAPTDTQTTLKRI